jgi:hypothetical protein
MFAAAATSMAPTEFPRQSAVEVHLLDKLAGRELKAASLIAKWRVPKAMIGRRLAEAKKLLAKFE